MSERFEPTSSAEFLADQITDGELDDPKIMEELAASVESDLSRLKEQRDTLAAITKFQFQAQNALKAAIKDNNTFGAEIDLSKVSEPLIARPDGSVIIDRVTWQETIGFGYIDVTREKNALFGNQADEPVNLEHSSWRGNRSDNNEELQEDIVLEGVNWKEAFGDISDEQLHNSTHYINGHDDRQNFAQDTLNEIFEIDPTSRERRFAKDVTHDITGRYEETHENVFLADRWDANDAIRSLERVINSEEITEIKKAAKKLMSDTVFNSFGVDKTVDDYFSEASLDTEAKLIEAGFVLQEDRDTLRANTEAMISDITVEIQLFEERRVALDQGFDVFQDILAENNIRDYVESFYDENGRINVDAVKEPGGIYTFVGKLNFAKLENYDFDRAEVGISLSPRNRSGGDGVYVLVPVPQDSWGGEGQTNVNPLIKFRVSELATPEQLSQLGSFSEAYNNYGQRGSRVVINNAQGSESWIDYYHFPVISNYFIEKRDELNNALNR